MAKEMENFAVLTLLLASQACLFLAELVKRNTGSNGCNGMYIMIIIPRAADADADAALQVLAMLVLYLQPPNSPNNPGPAAGRT